MEDYKTWHALYKQNELKKTKRYQQDNTQKTNMEFMKLIDSIDKNKKKEMKIIQCSNKNAIKEIQYFLAQTKIRENILNESAEENCLKQKVQDLSKILIRQQNQNRQIHEEIRLYIMNQESLKNITYKIQTEHEQITFKVKQFEKQYSKISNQYTTKLNQKLQEKQQLQLFINNKQNEKLRQQQKKKFQSIQINKQNNTVPSQNQQVFPIFSKEDIKNILKIFLQLSQLVNLNNNTKQNINVLSKQQTRIHSKMEIIEIFEKNCFKISNQIIDRFIEIYKIEKKKLVERQKELKLLEQNKNQLEQCKNNLIFQNGFEEQERIFLQKFKNTQQELNLCQNQNNLHSKIICIYNQFINLFLIKMITILKDIEKITSKTSKINRIHNLENIFNQYVENEAIKKYNNSIKENSQQRFLIFQQLFYRFNFPIEFIKYIKEERINKMFGNSKQFEKIFKEVKNIEEFIANYNSLTDKSYRRQKQFIQLSILNYKLIINNLIKKNGQLQRQYQPTNNLPETYCIQSKEYYRFDNYKLLDKLNKQSKKSITYDKEIVQEKKYHNQLRQEEENKKINKKIQFFFNCLNQSNIFKPKYVNKTQLSVCDNDMSTLVSQRRKMNQIKNMKIRTMLNVVNHIGKSEGYHKQRISTTRNPYNVSDNQQLTFSRFL